jgi:hypothetical protein
MHTAKRYSHRNDVNETRKRVKRQARPNTKGAAPLLMTQTQRAAAFRRYIETLVGLPFVVGYHMFMWMDEPAGGQLFGANSNFGLVHLSDDPYKVLTDAFAEINSLVTKWHLAGPQPPVPPPPPTPGQPCQVLPGLMCHEGFYCTESHTPTQWAYNGPDSLHSCEEQCAKRNCTCMMHNAVNLPPLHPACRVIEEPVAGLSPSHFGYNAWVRGGG